MKYHAVIFMDIKMPIMDGLVAAKVIKQQQKDTQVILLSLYKDLQAAAFAAGADDFIEKGTETQVIKNIVSRI